MTSLRVIADSPLDYVGTEAAIDAVTAAWSTEEKARYAFRWFAGATDTSKQGYWDGTQVVYDVTVGAAHVSQNGAVTAVSGTSNTYTLVAATAAGSGDAATQYITDATGYKGFTVDIQSDIAIGADEALMVCWSTDASDQVNCTGTLDALRTALGTPDGIGHANTFIMTIHTGSPPTVVWDGTTRIKTISVASQGTTAYDVVVRTVE